MPAAEVLRLLPNRNYAYDRMSGGGGCDLVPKGPTPRKTDWFICQSGYVQPIVLSYVKRIGDLLWLSV